MSGSFQAHDQSYLIDTLGRLGPGWVGVTQVPADISDAKMIRLAGIGAGVLGQSGGAVSRLTHLTPRARTHRKVAGGPH